MFGIPAWAIIATAGVVGLVLLVLGAGVIAGQKRRPRPPRHQRARDNHSRLTREGWLNGTDVIPRAEVAGAPPWPVRDDPGATIIEGPWGPVRQYPTPYLDAVLPALVDAEPEYLPAPELLDDLPPVPEHLIQHAYHLYPQPAAEIPPDQDAFGLCGCMCLCFDGADGPDNMCPRCRAGNHAPRRAADDDDPGWVTRLAAELDEDQAAELDEPDPFGPVPIEDQVAELDEDPLAPVRDYWAWQPPAPAEPELVLAEETHAAQLRAQDADAEAFMAGKAAEFATLRCSLTGPGR